MNSPWTPVRPSAAPLLHCLLVELWCECVRFRLHRHAWLSASLMPFHAHSHSKHLTYHECLNFQPGWTQLQRSRFYRVLFIPCCCHLHLYIHLFLLWICRCVGVCFITNDILIYCLIWLKMCRIWISIVMHIQYLDSSILATCIHVRNRLYK